MMPARETERMMKLQDVILKAMAKKLTWIQAAEIAGMSVRNMQRKRQSYQAGHPFYRKLESKLKEAGFDQFCEEECKRYSADGVGRPSLAPGVYFRLMLIGFFEGIDSERGIAWRVADSLSLRQFLGYGIDENTPDHVTISRTRRLLEAGTHKPRARR
jgi:transposase